MKNAFLTIVLTSALLAGPVAAQNASSISLDSLQSLSADQNDALVSVLSGLPRK